jgi:glycosyltransferase involved in cell wall biosynthesis
MRKKILYIHHDGGMGGAPRSLAFLIRELDLNTYEPIIWMMRDGEARAFFEKTGAKVIYNANKFIVPIHGTTVSGMTIKHFLRNVIGFFPTYFSAKKIINEISPDIIHLSTTCLFPFAIAAKSLKKKIKVISHIREPLLSNFFGKILLLGNVKSVDSFVAISNNDAKPFFKKGAKVSVVFNFVNIEDYKFNLEVRNIYREKLNLKLNTNLVVSFFGRVTQANGIHNIVKIAKGIQTQNIIFYVFGYTGITDYEKNIEETKPSNLILMPMITEVKEYLMATDVLLSPFTEAHFSRAVVEASAIGLSSIVSNVESQNELIKDKETGFLYNSNEEAIGYLNLLDNDRNLLKLMGKKARVFAENNFSAVSNAKQTFKNYV